MQVSFRSATENKRQEVKYMRRNIYEFKEQDAWDFARFMHAKTKQPKPTELTFEKCPYCNPDGKDKTNLNTFSISLKTGEFLCLRDGCKAHGNMVTLSKDWEFSLGNEVDEYYQPKRKFQGSEKLKKIKEPLAPKPEAVQYLESRGISERVAKEYEITVQTKDSKVLVFPFYDENGRLQLVKYRRTDYDPEKHDNKEWSEKDCKPILFGMKQCKNFDRLIITEGQVDSLSVAEAGIDNAVSVPAGAKGFTWVPYCWNWVNMFKEIVVFGDHEKGHITLLDDISRRFKCTIKHVREEDYKDCKDANEILKKYGAEQVRKCVENAICVPVPHVIRLADVKSINPEDVPKISTGIWQLDRILGDGLPMGGYSIIAGKTGKGKSVLASQIVVNALHKGHKCFVYSGELENGSFKGIMDFQVAGANGVNVWQDRHMNDHYNILKETEDKISAWYGDNIWIYDSSIIEDDEHDDLIKISERMIIQNGVDVILLDNLMTAVDLNCTYDSNEYKRQNDFVGKLAKLAMSHNVLVILVAHKRKNNFSTDETDETSGSGKIQNLAMVSLSYDVGKEIADTQRLLKVTKNRLFGKTELKGFVMDYDTKSRRIYGERDDPNFDYGWNGTRNDNDGFTEISEETPW